MELTKLASLLKQNLVAKVTSTTFVSYPHFIHGDSQLVDQFSAGSLSTEEGKHESYLVLEPWSGIPVEAAVRMQLNLLVRPVSVTNPGTNDAISIE